MAPSKVVTTCDKCMYVDTPYDEFPCNVCLNSGKLVENMVEPNWAPLGAVLAEKPVVKRCNNCRFGPLETYQYPCNYCLEEVDFERYWEPEEEKVETPAEPESDPYGCLKVSLAENPFKFNYRLLFGLPRYGKSFVTSAVLDGVGMTYTTVPAPKPFWIVCADGGSLEAHVRHDSEESATREANRLALKTGKTFQVFKSVAKVTGKTTARQENYA